ncbi:hypothetical protein EJ04DRAFT_111313 [Polyplosphaeria fusca]|uniref:Uncharacterized protein n=1 Tax=Polyplosphaeria fusca TaxID=682080 RepID=A0A9P4R819_9PLEO|nr:hypothetical protein EJ04DRAFT_111313 [Polyplosphaeria fusca]
MREHPPPTHQGEDRGPVVWRWRKSCFPYICYKHPLSLCRPHTAGIFDIDELPGPQHVATYHNIYITRRSQLRATFTSRLLFTRLSRRCPANHCSSATTAAVHYLSTANSLPSLLPHHTLSPGLIALAEEPLAKSFRLVTISKSSLAVNLD